MMMTEDEGIQGFVSEFFYAKDAVLKEVSVYAEDEHEFGSVDYVGGFEEDQSSVTFKIDLQYTGPYDIIISSTTISGWGDKLNYVLVNGRPVGEVTSKDDNEFSETDIKRVFINRGPTEITILKHWGWFFLDYIYLKHSEDVSKIAYTVSHEPVNPNADDSARRLLKYLTDIYGTQVLSGQTGHGIGSDEFRAVYSVTRKYPAIMGMDMMDYSSSRVAFGAGPSSTTENAIDWFNMGGIVKILWHWNAPKDLINEGDKLWWSGFYTDATTFSLEKALSGEDEEGYDLMIKDIDIVASEFKRLQDAGVPVLWRPLHEAAGRWFWWGASGPEPYKKLWIIMYERMTHHHGLNNLIWVWNGEDDDWFPGEEYVDIASKDIYAQPRDYSSQSPAFFAMVEALRDRGTIKPIALSETGVVPDINEMARDKAMWLFFVTWGGEFVLARSGGGASSYSPQHTEVGQLRRVYNDRRVVTLGDVPDLRNYPLD